MSAVAKTQYLISQKIRYLIRRDDASEEVTRKYRDIVWLHSQLRADFSGLKLPPVPENNLENIQSFFQELLKTPDIAGSYLFLFFVSCTNQAAFDQYTRLRDSTAATGKTDLQKTLNLDAISLTDAQLEGLKRVAAELPSIAKEPSADFDFLADSIFEFTQSFLAEFQALSKMLADIRTLFEDLGNRFRRAAESFGMLALQFKKLNFAKTQFSHFGQSNLSLDLVYNRYKLVFFETGFLIRQRLHQPSQGLRVLSGTQKRATAV
jgi:hypothetical protein